MLNIKSIFYFSIKSLLKAFTPFYFRRIRVFGRENLPKEGALLFSPNHQGAFLDPILVGAYVPGKLFSLTRGDVFVPPYRWVFDALQMLPVFRIRNGFSSLKNNDTTFDKCHEILQQGKNLMMFSEGLHHKEMFLYPVSKGSSRLIYNAQKKHPDNPMYLVPVGINYQDYQRPWKGLHLVFGTAISIQKYLSKSEKEVHLINRIRTELSQGMKDCLWIPENNEDYTNKVDTLQKIDCQQSFKTIRQLLDSPPKKIGNAQKKAHFLKAMIYLLRLPNALPFWITQKLIKSFSDPIFHGSVKFAAGLVIFPVWFIFTGLIAAHFAGSVVAVGLVLFLILVLYIQQYMVNSIF